MAHKEKKPKKEKLKAEYSLSVDYTKLAVDIAKHFPLDFPSIDADNILALTVKNIGKNKKLGQCRAVTEPWATIIRAMNGRPNFNLCYTIELNYDRIDALGFLCDKDFTRLKILLYHELKHILPNGTVIGEPAYKQIVSHDCEEFYSVYRLLGIKGPVLWPSISDIPDILKLKESPEQAHERLVEEGIAANAVEVEPEPDTE